MEHLGLSNIRPDDFIVYYSTNLYTVENTKDCHFHGFPDTQGWKFDPSTSTIKRPGVDAKAPFIQLMQSWLFFGLIAAVVYDDNSRPFDWELLVSEDRVRLNTEKLPQILEDWRLWELDIRNRPGQNMRMIRAQLALDVARKVIKNHSPRPDINIEEDQPLELNPHLALSLMVLGETLTNAKAKIIDQVGFKARDWYGDASIGWGSPSAVLKKMNADDWCPRTTKLLRAQLRENATALLSAYASHGQHKFEGHKEAKCDETMCYRKSEVAGKYATKHHPDCVHGGDNPCQPDHTECHAFKRNKVTESKMQAYENSRELPTCHTPCRAMVGVKNMQEVVKIIEADKIPLFKFNKRTSRKDPIELQVMDSTQCQDYATISHVWSDGYGNPNDNKLWRCQLAYFWDLLREAQIQKNRQKMGEAKENPDPLPFWIDTLAIPVQDENKSARKKAISQIYRVYSRARYTIVIDNGLSDMSWTDKDYTTTAMRILASGWMRRLWTLQEAYLSRKLLFAFQRWPNDKKDIPLVDLDEIEELYVDTEGELISSLPANARSYYHNMLGQDRKARIHGLISTNSVGLVASVWKAAQWRTTSKIEHETLALATLLNLDYQHSSFAGGELLKGHERDRKLKEYMRDFWLLLEENSPGAIPPGIIFLPGDRIELRGFGWAPLSWMEAQGVDYPDPISVISKSAKLVPEMGLLVEFPGFLLHCQDRNAIVEYTSDKGFWFPSDSSLSEWYHVERADGKEYSTKKGIVNKQRIEDLAIILSRPRPREMAEIGLLVEIHTKKEQRELGKDSGRRIFAVYMLGRVNVKRETDEDKLSQRRRMIIESRKDEYREKIICGEVLEEDQQWYVDSRTTIDEEMGEDSKISTRAASEVNIPATGRSRPYGMRGGGEGPTQNESNQSASQAGTETPEQALSTHTVAGSSTHKVPQPAEHEGTVAGKTPVEETQENGAPNPGNLKRSTTDMLKERFSFSFFKNRSSTTR